MDLSKNMPISLNGAVNYLYEKLPQIFLNEIYNYGATVMHFGLGKDIRNAWLWQKTPLSEFFKNTYQLGHADDMSAMILYGLEKMIKSKNTDYPKLAQELREFWYKQGIDPLTLEPIKKEIPVITNHYYECHITLEEDFFKKSIIQQIVECLKWKFSAIDGDPVLGKGIKMYATKQFSGKNTPNQVKAELENTEKSLKEWNLNVIRTKIEDVIFDSKSNKIIF